MLSSVFAAKTPRRVTVATTLVIHLEYTMKLLREDSRLEFTALEAPTPAQGGATPRNPRRQGAPAPCTARPAPRRGATDVSARLLQFNFFLLGGRKVPRSAWGSPARSREEGRLARWPRREAETDTDTDAGTETETAAPPRPAPSDATHLAGARRGSTPGPAALGPELRGRTRAEGGGRRAKGRGQGPECGRGLGADGPSSQPGGDPGQRGLAEGVAISVGVACRRGRGVRCGRGLREMVAVLGSFTGGTSEAGFCRGRGFWRCGRGLRLGRSSREETPGQSGLAVGVASSAVGVALVGGVSGGLHRGAPILGVASAGVFGEGRGARKPEVPGEASGAPRGWTVRTLALFCKQPSDDGRATTVARSLSGQLGRSRKLEPAMREA